MIAQTKRPKPDFRRRSDEHKLSSLGSLHSRCDRPHSASQLTRSVESRGLSGRLLLKLEYFSPGGSKKDRIALEIIREARASGELRPGQTVVELTSGNTGTGLAVVCRALGHPFVPLISRGNSVERVRQMEAFGAEVIIVEQAEGAVDGQVSGEDLACRGASRGNRVAARHLPRRSVPPPRQHPGP